MDSDVMKHEVSRKFQYGYYRLKNKVIDMEHKIADLEHEITQRVEYEEDLRSCIEDLKSLLKEAGVVLL